MSDSLYHANIQYIKSMIAGRYGEKITITPRTKEVLQWMLDVLDESRSMVRESNETIDNLQAELQEIQNSKDRYQKTNQFIGLLKDLLNNYNEEV